MKTSIIFCVAIYFSKLFSVICFAVDTLTSSHAIIDGNESTLVSSGQIFELGFFSPGNSKYRYVGIWRKTTPDVVSWVANRNNPLVDSSGEFTIDDHGDLVVLDRAKRVVWTSNSSRETKNPAARLLDSGNLVVGESEYMSSEAYFWQSFDHPTDTLLEGMKLGWDLRIGFERRLTSWRSVDDPAEGDFVLRMDIQGLPQAIVETGSTRTMRIGPWNGVELSGYTVRYIPVYIPMNVFNETESYLMFKSADKLAITKLTLNNAGQVKRAMLEKDHNQWSDLYSMPYDPCDEYGYCGANGVCKVDGDPICQCLEGFVPSSREEWEILNWSKGCVRRTPLGCLQRDGYVKLDGVKLPDLLEFWLNESMSLEECKETCLKNCSCVAYANSDVSGRGSGCLIWLGNLIDVRELRVKNTKHVVNVRLSASEIKAISDGSKRRRLKITKLGAFVSSAMCMFFLLLCCAWALLKRAKGKSEDSDIDLPLLDLATLKNATRNFSPENMIGEGGFGPVYKGNLSTGPDIAVKRLSKNSGQGPQEFKNEVELIAKLQHKNLVELLGCCIEGDERLLIYEYMPNKSLDYFIFGSEGDKRSNALAWEKIFDIVMGITRGLLYLHQDSKLQIIHRDLKAANILLDSNMNPKISDFGLARIFRGDEKEDRTKTIVGTYGYISPEYAIDGKFSIKSDVFSFGVLLLEIVSGKRNRKFSHPDHHHNLLGHAWLAWNKGEALDLMDVCFRDSCVETQVLRCIQVGLLCVQKYPEDRPKMNTVILMLANEGASLPRPKEPGFFTERSSSESGENSKSGNEQISSQNRVTITLEARL